ncbi:T9SS type A sorting domain-containing protein [Thalassobellus citreus]|uniref:T9SS type A sorting domain-containing protein n=1 Tax=Thalassobellus citreus TaxID=3367752 RepID=UPI00379346E7
MLKILFLCIAHLALAQKSNFIIKSTLTCVGSSSISLKNQTKAYFIQQSIGQSGIIGLKVTNKISAQQGFLNHIKLITVNNPTVSIKETISFNIYPNPVINYLNISFEKEPVKSLQIDLFNSTGKLIFSNEYPPNKKIIIPLNNLEEAMYLLQIRRDNIKATKKIIKVNK